VLWYRQSVLRLDWEDEKANEHPKLGEIVDHDRPLNRRENSKLLVLC
jgi:hypothetical protein